VAKKEAELTTDTTVVTSRTVTGREGDWWEVILEWAWVDDRLEVVGIQLRCWFIDTEGNKQPLPDGLRPVTTGLLRSVSLPRLIDEMKDEMVARGLGLGERHALMRKVLDAAGQAPSSDARELLERAQAGERPRSRQGRRTVHGDEHYRQVAETYRAAHEAGENPTQAVKRTLGAQSDSTASRWVREARARGLLAKGRPGRPFKKRED
jgi:hypothetical protein